MLSALRPAAIERLRFPLADLTKPAGAGASRRRGPAGGLQAREPGPVLPGRARASARSSPATAGLAERPGRGRRLARKRASAAIPAITTSRSASDAGSGVGGGEPLYVLETDARDNRVVVGAREELARARVRVRDAHARRPGARVDSVKLRYRSRPIACAVRARPAATTSSGWS